MYGEKVEKQRKRAGRYYDHRKYGPKRHKHRGTFYINIKDMSFVEKKHIDFFTSFQTLELKTVYFFSIFIYSEFVRRKKK